MAGFSTAVTGIKATTTALDVTGNNISNASTVGFKASRTEFGDIYSSSVVGAGSSNTPGAGATVGDIAQDFSSGTIEFTNSNLDLAINGSGFFQLNDGQGGTSYTRSGAFELDKDGFIVSKNGKNLMGFGLDSQGNQLPLQKLSVQEKESPPHHTENIALAFNINAADDAEENSPYYSKDDASSYTYTTTVETYDSLGNANAVKFNIVEQRAVREVYTYSPADGAGASGVGAAAAPIPINPAAAAGAANEFEIAGVPIVWDAAATAPYVPDTATIDAIKQADPRIDTASISYTVGTATAAPILTFELKASATQAGDVVVKQYDATPALQDLDITNLTNEGKVTLREANETLTFSIDTTVTPAVPGPVPTTEAFTNNADGVPVLKIDMDIRLGINGGVTRTLGANSTIEDIAQVINGDYADELMANDPRIESVVFDLNTNEIKITWKPEAGDIDTSAYVINGNANTGVTLGTDPYLFTVTTPATPATTLVTTNVKGDNSFEGTYRLYAYLNENQLLDIGKSKDPGEGSGHETGPIVIEFNNTSGALESVDGTPVLNGNVPKITIWGADPANVNDDVLEGDVDTVRGIQLDITNTTQYSSSSIVKASSQDGYAKGDLIGVTFNETGEMVASYSNGQRSNIGIVALATFDNQDGLQAAGDSEWVATLASGQATLNPPGTGLNGTLRSAALEQSNVDLSEELVKLIEYQRNYQANSKTLETLNTVTQSVLQI